MPRRIFAIWNIVMIITVTHIEALTLFKSCGNPPCLCFQKKKVVACSTLGPPLSEVPLFNAHEVENMTELNLARNSLSQIGPLDINRRVWKSLAVVDLRVNPDLDCSTLKNIPIGVRVLSTCAYDDSHEDGGLHLIDQAEESDIYHHPSDQGGPMIRNHRYPNVKGVTEVESLQLPFEPFEHGDESDYKESDYVKNRSEDYTEDEIIETYEEKAYPRVKVQNEHLEEMVPMEFVADNRNRNVAFKMLASRFGLSKEKSIEETKGGASTNIREYESGELPFEHGDESEYEESDYTDTSSEKYPEDKYVANYEHGEENVYPRVKVQNEHFPKIVPREFVADNRNRHVAIKMLTTRFGLPKAKIIKAAKGEHSTNFTRKQTRFKGKLSIGFEGVIKISVN